MKNRPSLKEIFFHPATAKKVLGEMWADHIDKEDLSKKEVKTIDALTKVSMLAYAGLNVDSMIKTDRNGDIFIDVTSFAEIAKSVYVAPGVETMQVAESLLRGSRPASLAEICAACDSSGDIDQPEIFYQGNGLAIVFRHGSREITCVRNPDESFCYVHGPTDVVDDIDEKTLDALFVIVNCHAQVHGLDPIEGVTW